MLVVLGLFPIVGAVFVLGLWVWLVGVIIYYGQCLSVVLHRRSRVRMGLP